MVSLITEGSSADHNGRRFQRRRWVPWVATVSIVAVVGLVVWIRAFSMGEASTTAMSCNTPALKAAASSAPAPAPLGKRVGTSRLLDVEPAPLAATQVRVYNANGQRGQATKVAADLGDYGFGSAPDNQVGNDPVYVDLNMECNGQIRFGGKGAAAAATLQLVAPCAELIEDTREDATVDLALGTHFYELRPNADAEEVLRTLKSPPPGSAPAPVDAKLLEAARTAKC